MRRFMMRIAERIALKKGCGALITGESLGQVASQTIESITVTNAAVSLPVFRPLIGMDKDDIIAVSKKIDTFDISIRPYEDCCTVFLPKNPVIHPRLQDVLEMESKLDVAGLTEQAVQEALAPRTAE
jgi:thiamine biosynthesis protein ThiI